MNKDYQNEFQTNQKLWDNKTSHHIDSEFYQMERFRKGWNSLCSISQDCLGDIQGKKLLHLQCHFGQDSLSMSRMGAQVLGVDFSEVAIDKARELAIELNLDTQFLNSSVYDLDQVLDEQFDIVYTSYGAICWLPDMNHWAAIVAKYLKPGGKLVLVEFHPMIYMYDWTEKTLKYDYFNTKMYTEQVDGSYAQKDAQIHMTEHFWNHSLSEVFQALKENKLIVEDFKEYDEAPYPCFEHMLESRDGWYQFDNGLSSPHVYSYIALKK